MKVSRRSISFQIGARCPDKTGEEEEEGEEEEKAWLRDSRPIETALVVGRRDRFTEPWRKIS